MTWNGFLENCRCKNCNKPLSGQDGPRPAESYAGTYTGLCYDCEGAKDFVLTHYQLDSCKLISTPPSCPSWRRERETYYAYDDCSNCKGKGYTWKSGTYGGFSRHYCEPCINRFSEQETRKLATTIKCRRSTIIRAAENRYTAALLAEIKKQKLSKKKKISRIEALDILGDNAFPIRDKVKADADAVILKHEKSRAYAWANKTLEDDKGEK